MEALACQFDVAESFALLKVVKPSPVHSEWPGAARTCIARSHVTRAGTTLTSQMHKDVHRLCVTERSTYRHVLRVVLNPYTESLPHPFYMDIPDVVDHFGARYSACRNTFSHRLLVLPDTANGGFVYSIVSAHRGHTLLSTAGPAASLCDSGSSVYFVSKAADTSLALVLHLGAMFDQ